MISADKLFFHNTMKWPKVLLLSVVCGIIPGLLMIPDFLEGTSLKQPGISFEFWIFMALFIVLNCRKPFEAGLKTFVFFLISQPLIYLVQVPFSWQHWHLFSYYPRWGIITLLTFPGGMLAWYLKKRNWLSIIILSLANALLCFELPEFVKILFNNFPRLKLTVCFIIFEIIFFALLIFKKTSHRIITLAVAVLIAFAVFFSEFLSVKPATFVAELPENEPYTVVSEYDDVQIELSGRNVKVTAKSYINCTIELTDRNGNYVDLFLSYDKDGGSLVLTDD